VARPSLASLLTLVAIVVAPACAALEPETGDRLSACVDTDSDPNVKVSFAKDLRPLINGLVPGPKPCANCHFPNSGTHEGFDETNLNLTTLRWLRLGGNRTRDTIIVKGHPCQSAVIQKIRGTFGQGARMPKGGPYLSPQQIQLFMDWIAEGAEGDDKE
jgi:hypothetical protein